MAYQVALRLGTFPPIKARQGNQIGKWVSKASNGVKVPGLTVRSPTKVQATQL